MAGRPPPGGPPSQYPMPHNMPYNQPQFYQQRQPQFYGHQYPPPNAMLGSPPPGHQIGSPPPGHISPANQMIRRPMMQQGHPQQQMQSTPGQVVVMTMPMTSTMQGGVPGQQPRIILTQTQGGYQQQPSRMFVPSASPVVIPSGQRLMHMPQAQQHNISNIHVQSSPGQVPRPPPPKASPAPPPPPSPSQPPVETMLLDASGLDELVASVDPNEQLDDDVKEALLHLADNFVDKLIDDSCKLAKHRNSNTLEVKDVQLCLERNYQMWIPGFGRDELRPYKKASVTDAHKQNGPDQENFEEGCRTVAKLLVKHDAVKAAFYCQLGENSKTLALLEYDIHAKTMSINHTNVPEQFRGLGIAEKLASTAFDWAEQNELSVKPVCTYIQHYLLNAPQNHKSIAINP